MMAARSQLAPRALSGAPPALLLAQPHLLACLPQHRATSQARAPRPARRSTALPPRPARHGPHVERPASGSVERPGAAGSGEGSRCLCSATGSGEGSRHLYKCLCSASAAPREDGEDGRRCQSRRREGREEPAAQPPSTRSRRPFRSPQVAAASVFREREQKGTRGGRGKDSIPAKFGAGRLGIVGGLPQAWPNVSWHCCPIPRADIETIQTAEFEPI